jgi:hypothetical protein
MAFPIPGRYKQNRAQRKAQEGWRTGRPWLTLNHTNNSMDCSWCHQRWTYDTDSDDYSDNDEDYGDEGRVYRVMCREGIIEE